ncbi:hypothetical protein [uncultured Stenotrophomonas sp.]|uniref:hypothetical protein n=1 Tax=uncultured Stenotrophomonas sp. TaxID=165438 RepID=UPI00258A053F|nr:hypothetical protein [uncultured Stenotrophomonas sp.]
MPQANWDAFTQLPGAATSNFEKLCRSLVRRHYGRFGHFRELANQPGVEFHLQLTEDCVLGKVPQWIGWQCKWYQSARGARLTAAQRMKIEEGLQKTRAHVPGVSDWKLWTRHPLVKSDQEWFYGLNSKYPQFKLDLLTADDVEELLAGPGAILRDTYFGELVITPDMLAQQYRIAAAPFQRRYQPEVHVVQDAEANVTRCLGGQDAWQSIADLAGSLRDAIAEISPQMTALLEPLQADMVLLLKHVANVAALLDELYVAIIGGDFDAIKRLLATMPASPSNYRRLLSRLRGARATCAPLSTNLVADLHAVASEVKQLDESLGARSLYVMAAAGDGKSEMCVKVTQPEGAFPGGVLLLGKDLHAGHTLDDLASGFKVNGKSVETFERLVEAMDAAGHRAGRRLPIVVDGLNESEDPRNWKDLLSRADELLKAFPYVLLVATLRNEFADDCLPEGLGMSSASNRFELNGFKDDPQAAIDKYFAFYRIDRTDADLPLELLQHPLTLRIYCEVANVGRQHTVGVEALPNSLVALFEEHFKRVAVRVADLTPSSRRIFQDEVHEAMRKIAAWLWDNNARSMPFDDARVLIDGGSSWSASIIRALESEGVLVRTAFEEGLQGIAFSYDLMAGHMLAQYILKRRDVTQWFQSAENQKMLDSGKPGSHTLASDAFYALVGLYPGRGGQRQLWQELRGNLLLRALMLTAHSDPAQIGRETVDRFAEAMLDSGSNFATLSFNRLRATRAAQAHPYDANFLHTVLSTMTNTQRDLVWSEWLRMKATEIERDLKFLTERWENETLGPAEIRRARWVMWTLTSTVRFLRDLATRALYAFALKQPAQYFDLALESLSCTDTYVPERMFAAGYGAALSAWADSSAATMRRTLPATAKAIVRMVFVPDAVAPVRHALLRQYCLGIVGIARSIEPHCVSAADAAYLLPPFAHMPSPFDALSAIPEDDIERADRAAITMDFGNYTFGRLVPNRSNYDYKHADYVAVRRAIVIRMIQLGYDAERFGPIDGKLNSWRRQDGDKEKVDRYGKKYGWIAYFEMWGQRSDDGLLDPMRNDGRPSDVDIDPTFPPKPRHLTVQLAELFNGHPAEPKDWIVGGPVPDYQNILESPELDGLAGPWVLLDGFIEQNAKSDYRQIFSFLRGLLVDRSDVEPLTKLFGEMAYPGNSAIPDAREHFYTYAGEMPFKTAPGMSPRMGAEDEEEFRKVSSDRWSGEGIAVIIPVEQYRWESYHSQLNPHGGTELPSTELCEALGLSYRADQWDLYDVQGVASLYREVGGDDKEVHGHLSYLRADLLDRYLAETGKALVWLIWGERGLHYRATVGRSLHGLWADHKHVHKNSFVREDIAPTVGTPKMD